MRIVRYSTLFVAALALVAVTPASAQLFDSASSSPGLAYGDGVSPPSITDTISVTGSAVTSITTIIIDLAIDHGWVGDNNPVTLTKVGGPTITLFAMPGSLLNGPPDFGDSSDLCALFPITFSDAAVPPAEDMGSLIGDLDCIGNPALGSPNTYHPDDGAGALTFLNGTFAGEDFNGDWELSITDSYPAFTGGILHSWGIRVMGIPEPATMSLLGIGGLALLLRRRR